MPNFICTTCGTQFAESDQPPAECTICTDERQFVGWNGQQWTTLADLRESHRIVVRLAEVGLYGIGMEPSLAIEFWDGETKQIGHGLTLIRCGGHFEGGTVLHWPDGAGGDGVILSGDILQVVQDRRWVSFMYSYPNLIPLPASTVQRIVDAVDPFAFNRIYGAWWGKVVATDAKAAVRRSADRYIRAIQD